MPLFLNVPLLKITRFCTNLPLSTKRAPFGTIHISVSDSYSIEKLLICLATQYCDGLRGAIVIYDPDDPFKDLYDFDDGKGLFPRIPVRLTTSQRVPLLHLQIGITSALVQQLELFRESVVCPLLYLMTTYLSRIDSNLINGKGRWSNEPTADLAVITVKQGKRYII